MPRQNIYFTEETLGKLRKFIKEKHGTHRAISITVQQAVEEFLQKQSKQEKQPLLPEPYEGRG